MPRVAAALTILLGLAFLDVCGYLIWVAVHADAGSINLAPGASLGAVLVGIPGLIIFFQGVERLAKAPPRTK